MLLNYLRGTTTSTGLTVKAMLLEGVYAKGQKISDTEMPTNCATRLLKSSWLIG